MVSIGWDVSAESPRMRVVNVITFTSHLRIRRVEACEKSNYVKWFKSIYKNQKLIYNIST